MPAISTLPFAKKVFCLLDRKIFNARLPILAPGINIHWTLANSASAFTRPSSTPGHYVVNIGLLAPAQVLGYGSVFPDKATALKYLKSISWVFQGLVYHEVSHLVYTDMLCDDIVKYPVNELRPFVANVSNIIEDIHIEVFGMGRKFPFTRKYFAYNVRLFHLPAVSKYVDHGDATSFINFLLLYLRCGKAMKAAGKRNKVWDSHVSDLKPLLVDALTEPQPHERVLKSIRFCEWLFKNVPEVDWKTAPEPESGQSGIGSMSGSGASQSPCSTSSNGESESGEAGSTSGQTSRPDPNRQGSSKAPTHGDNYGHAQKEGGPKTVDELDSVDLSEVDDGYDPSFDIPLEDLPESYDGTTSVLGADDDHVFIHAASYYIPSDFVKGEVDSLIVKSLPISNGIRIAFNKFTAHIKPLLTGGFHGGRLDTRALIRQQLNHTPDTKLFMRRVPRGVAPDVAFSILCDNSGSMSGNKSFVTTRAMIAFAKACDMCRIPCEVNLFVDGSYNNYTITLKEFEDDFEKAKPYFGIAHSRLIRDYNYDYPSVENFSGNVDEVNLHYVWERFKKNPHKDKVVIVISDGLTCGSSRDLKKVVDEISRQGGFVIGLGIQSKVVSEIYPYHKVFQSAESLADLPAFMAEMVMDFITGKEA